MPDIDGDGSRTTPDETDPVARETEPAPDQAATGDADHLVLSYPADLSEWGRFQVEKPEFEAFLRKTLDTVAVGDTWEEFVGVGCCGNTLDVPLRVEAVTGGRRVGPDTDVDYEVRSACGIEGGWQVQSEAGPNEF